MMNSAMLNFLKRPGLLIWSVGLLVACREPVPDMSVVTIDWTEAEKALPLSVLADSLRYVPLETKEDCVLGGIDHLEIDSRGNFYVLDREGTNAVYKFDASGRFVSKIGERGRGPGEYVEADAMVLYGDTLVEVWDSESGKMICYSSSGRFLKETPGRDWGSVSDYEHWGNTRAFYSSCGGYSPNLKVVADSLEYGFFQQDYPEIYARKGYLSVWENRLYCTTDFNDTIYRLEGDRLQPFVAVDFGKHRVPPGIRDHTKLLESDYGYDIGNVRFTDRYVYFSYSYGRMPKLVVGDRKQKEWHVAAGLNNDIDGVPLNWCVEGMPNRSEGLVTYIYSSWLSAQCDYNEDNGLPVSATLAELTKKVGEDSNPVIVFIYTKED